MARFLSLALLLGPLLTRADSPMTVRLNSVGYLPSAPKHATVVEADTELFEVVRVPDGEIVLSGRLGPEQWNQDTNEHVRAADFSRLDVAGRYRLRVGQDSASAEFEIGDGIYRTPFRLAMGAMHLWRCGMAVQAEWQGTHFAQEACHLGDAWLNHATGEHRHRDATGGWHDAGDYNKYVVNAGVTVGAMLRAWEDFAAVRSVRFGLPKEEPKLPEFLAELKYELDWLLKMQDEAGRVYTKVSTERFGGFILPQHEHTRRYFAPWGTPATASFVAMLAQASRAFEPHDPAYAKQCLEAARRSYTFLAAHPKHHEPDQSAFRTGGYRTDDEDDRLWAAAEIWQTTGSPEALHDVEARIRQANAGFAENFDWGDVKNLGFFTYLFSDRAGRDPALVAALRESLLAVATKIVVTAQNHGYSRPLGNRYYWGGNGGVARQTLLLHGAHRLHPDGAFRTTALDALNHLFGRNVHGRSYVTGLGFAPPLFPHDRRSGGDDVTAPWPGYLVGGPHPGAGDWHDVQDDYRTNEIAINWNGALIYALAMFLDEAP